MARITVEIIESAHEKAPGHTGGEVIVLGYGVFKVGDRIEGLDVDLKPLVDAGHARLATPEDEFEFTEGDLPGEAGEE